MAAEPGRELAADLTDLLGRWGHGDREAVAQLMPRVYQQLHRLAHRAMHGERGNHTLQATALVHEAFLRLADDSQREWRDRRHFFAVAARLMRHILVDHARRLQAQRRGGSWQRVALADPDGAANPPDLDILALDEALVDLAQLDQRKARVVELRFFGGLSVQETAELLQVSKPTIILDTRLARAWLYQRLQEPASTGGDR